MLDHNILCLAYIDLAHKTLFRSVYVLDNANIVCYNIANIGGMSLVIAQNLGFKAFLRVQLYTKLYNPIHSPI